MKLHDYIRATGVDKSAALFNVKPRTVMSWMYGERTPRPAQANTIVSATKGKVTMNDIYIREAA